MAGPGGTVNSSQRAYGEVGAVELVESESAVDGDGLARPERSLPYTLSALLNDGVRQRCLSLP